LVFPDLISLPSNDADPCLTTKIKAFNVTSMVNTALYGESVQKIDYQLDNVAASKNDDTYCGVPRYSITVQNKEV
jgi:predicted transcriptional regulator